MARSARYAPAMEFDQLESPADARVAAPFVADVATAEAAIALIADYGPHAGLLAAARAQASRDVGNVAHFCRWRQVERLIVALGARGDQSLH